MYLFYVLNHDALDICNCAANAADRVRAGVVAPVVHAVPQHRAELHLILVRGRAVHCVPKGPKKLLLGLLQKGEWYPPSERLQSDKRSPSVKIKAS